MPADTTGENAGIADIVAGSLKKRRAAELRFRSYGLIAIAIAATFLGILFFTILRAGIPAFQQTEILIPIDFLQQEIDPDGTGDPRAIFGGNYRDIFRTSLYAYLGITDADARTKAEARTLFTDFARFELRDFVVKHPEVIGTTTEVWLPAASNVDQFVKGQISEDTPEDRRLISNRVIAWIGELEAAGNMDLKFNTYLFTRGASSKPETAGLYAALIGSFFMMVTVLLLAVPIGVASAIYLEEFAPKNRWTDIIEVNINNLAAVPSIVFGILGLAVFINFLGLPQSSPLVGGLVLTLMTLPTVIIATRAAVRAVPPSIREAALGVGASKTQSVLHHVLPLAAPGVLTGTIIGLAQALGETAPLLMIGLLAFVVEAPASPLDSGTALPVQIYLWSTYAERGFVERTSAAIIVLLAFMLAMNALAIFLRRRFERRW